VNPRFNQRDYEFLHESEEDQAARLEEHRVALQTARQDLFKAKHAMMNENERIEKLIAKGIRHKNKMHKFSERVERARAHLMEMEDSPLTHVLRGMQNAPIPS
jgi:predicted  nucleic acid-binding Zn-ribbon protein